jgi:alpha-N-acetylglucosamine transferase
MSRPSARSCAYVTLVTNDDFALGARVLAKSIIAAGCRYPLVVLTTFEGPTLDPLRALGCDIRLVSPPEVSDGFKQRHAREQVHGKAPFTKGNKPAFHSPLDNFAKLRLWLLTEFETLVFLDADTMMLRACDRLFDYPAFSAAPNVYAELADFNRMNSGVFVAKPSADTYAAMLERLDAPEAFWRRTDQTFLQDFYPDWHGLPYTYNALQYVYFQLPELWNWPELKLLHFQYEKPWQADHPKRAQLQPLIDLWQHMDATGELLAEGPHTRPAGA